MSRHARFVAALADILLTNNWRNAAMCARLYWALDQKPAWVAPLVRYLLIYFPEADNRPDKTQLIQIIADNPGFRQFCHNQGRSAVIRRYWLKAPMPAPAHFVVESALPESVVDLARWLGLTSGQLDHYQHPWRQNQAAADSRHEHYHYHWRQQKGLRQRLIEAPKARLAQAQRQIYLAVLEPLPLHPACHGFRRGHDRLSFAAPHAGRAVVIKTDLQQFFTSIPYRRIYGVFKALGYNDGITRSLTGLCCHRTPERVLRSHPHLRTEQRQQLRVPHLPQGSPSSPALANLCAFKLDVRLAGLAKKFSASYSRYADDLAFSGDRALAANADQLLLWVAIIADEEGFALNHRKSRVMRQGVSQRLTGLTVNQFVNCPRQRYDRLKATLYNCIRHGPADQNRNQHPDFRAHLTGRIAEIGAVNPNKAAKLQRLFEQIQW